MPPFCFQNITPLPFLCHGIFGRRQGSSTPPFNSLNIGLSTGDDRQSVLANRKQIIQHMGGGTALFLNQVHSDRIAVLKKDEVPSPDSFQDSFQGMEADAAITDIPKVILFISVADCQPIMLADPEKKVVANVHSGWKGSIQNILGKTVTAMEELFGSNPKNIIAGIGPSLGPCCAEFIHYKKEIPKTLWSYKDDTSNLFDFWRMSRDQLLGCGVVPENIENMNQCTRCNSDLFFSYRKEKITGRFASVIKIF